MRQPGTALRPEEASRRQRAADTLLERAKAASLISELQGNYSASPSRRKKEWPSHPRTARRPIHARQRLNQDGHAGRRLVAKKAQRKVKRMIHAQLT